MPWIQEDRNPATYIGSIFNDSILPTYVGMFEWANMEDRYSFDGEPKGNNPYFGKPHKAVLMVQMVNQINKMIHEDKIEVPKLPDYTYPPFFVIECDEYRIEKHVALITSNRMQPVVHELHTPKGSYDAFRLDDVKSIDLTDHIDHIKIIAIGQVSGHMFIELDDSEKDMIIDRLFDSVKRYFEEPVGWK